MLRVRTWRRLVLLLFLLIFPAIIYRWISLERLRQAAIPPETTSQTATPEGKETPTPEPSPTKPPVITHKVDTGKLFNGLTLHSSVETPPGADAATERTDPDSYVVDVKLQARMPVPNKSIEDLAKVTPRLPELLPGLASMITADSVSPLFQTLYNTKVRILRDNLARLDALLSRHNFYDCQTVLQFEHPQTHRKALLLQADMDVDADGSDSDRMPASAGAPTNFKPFTSYKWGKKTDVPNPYLPGIEEKLRRAEDELSLPATSADRKRDLRGAIAQYQNEIGTLKKFSFLIGTTDPYIVIPGVFAKTKDGGRVGDYALVIFGNGVYPALVGDIGPNDKVGEASLRIAKEVNATSTAYNRPVSDLKVTYLIFPGSADTPFGPPDWDKIGERCQKLVDEIGGASVPLHHWENIIPPPPTPTPTPTPTPSPAPSVSPSATSTTSSESSTAASPAATFAFPIPSGSP